MNLAMPYLTVTLKTVSECKCFFFLVDLLMIVAATVHPQFLLGLV